MSGGLRVRRNVDGLTSELADYIYAFQKLKEPGRPYYDSYDYFQALHDRMGKKLGEGMCEHGNETFLPWHRAHLFAFEEALRKTDPPRTSNITVPYWDWSVMPTGDRYPKAGVDAGYGTSASDYLDRLHETHVFQEQALFRLANVMVFIGLMRLFICGRTSPWSFWPIVTPT